MILQAAEQVLLQKNRLQIRIEQLLVAYRCRWAMARINHHILRQSQYALRKSCNEGCMVAAFEIGAADAPLKYGIAGEENTLLFAV